MNKAILGVSAVAILGVGIGIGYFVGNSRDSADNNANNNQAAIASPVPTLAATNNGKELMGTLTTKDGTVYYSNADLGLSFAYPVGWELEEYTSEGKYADGNVYLKKDGYIIEISRYAGYTGGGYGYLLEGVLVEDITVNSTDMQILGKTHRAATQYITIPADWNGDNKPAQATTVWNGTVFYGAFEVEYPGVGEKVADPADGYCEPECHLIGEYNIKFGYEIYDPVKDNYSAYHIVPQKGDPALDKMLSEMLEIVSSVERL